MSSFKIFCNYLCRQSNAIDFITNLIYMSNNTEPFRHTRIYDDSENTPCLV